MQKETVTSSSSTLVKKISTNSFFFPTLRPAYHFSQDSTASRSSCSTVFLLLFDSSVCLSPLVYILHLCYPSQQLDAASLDQKAESIVSSGNPGGIRRAGLHPAAEWGNTEPGEQKILCMYKSYCVGDKWVLKARLSKRRTCDFLHGGRDVVSVGSARCVMNDIPGDVSNRLDNLWTD